MSFQARAAPGAARLSYAFRTELIDILISIVIALVMAGLSWWLAGAPGTNGIDDAAITRSYADNIAHGHGFVYNIGGERVEGATSLLWVMLLAVPYLFDDNPEIPILVISALLTIFSIFLALRIVRRIAGPDGTLGVAATAVAFLGLPAFFVWSIWSMMEIALWSALIMLLLNSLSALVEEPGPSGPWNWPLLVAAVALPLTRPEGVAVSAGLILLAGVLRPIAWKTTAMALAATIGSFGLLTVGRLAYFGVPFPNTYYAKVSSDRIQNFVDGTKYFASFIFGMPFAELLLLSWLVYAGANIIGLLRRDTTPARRSGLLAAATVLGMFFVYIGLGGDHFALWRFYQPVMPIITLPIIIGALHVYRANGWPGKRVLLTFFLVACLVWLGLSNLFYHQARFGMLREFALSARGERFGTFMNRFDPTPSLGVSAAGGIALTYNGELRDLMGLNWFEMAHANPIKIGMRNHASFDVETFWKHPPDLLPQFDKTDCHRNDWTLTGSEKSHGIPQLFVQPRFQETFTPILLEKEDICVNAFASNSWLSLIEDNAITIIGWDNVTIIDEDN